MNTPWNGYAVVVADHRRDLAASVSTARKSRRARHSIIGHHHISLRHRATTPAAC